MPVMNAKQLTAAAEAVLFASGEPIELKRIAQALGIGEGQAEQIVLNLAALLDERESGLQILSMEDKFQMCTRPDYVDTVRGVLEVKRNAPLSQAAFEVLAVVAYNQPVTKAFMEQVRGVDCSGVLSSLVQKGLVEECGRLELPGRPLLYKTTADFLRCFSISSLEELPPLPAENPPEEKPADSEEKLDSPLEQSAPAGYND